VTTPRSGWEKCGTAACYDADVSYRLTEAGQQEVLARFMRRRGAAYATGIAAFIAFTFRHGLADSTLPAKLQSVGIVMLLAGVAHGYASRRQRLRLASYEIILGPGHVTRRQLNSPDYTLARDQIARIEETPRGMLLRPAEKGALPLVVYSGLADYAALRDLLAGWGKPVG
jgi:hypothetical protein